ncbi:MAG: hypothetical protein D6732_04835 [Methanobacteriota archaeon]|nr:MAG: hypothetical protein D6732_04835 [Euryarchaeota archaeon]
MKIQIAISRKKTGVAVWLESLNLSNPIIGIVGKQLKISYFGTKTKINQRASRAISGEFLRDELGDIGADFRQQEIESDGEKLKVQVWDVVVSKMTKSIRKRFYLGTKAVILQMDGREMLDSLDEIIREIRQTSPRMKIAAVIDRSDDWARENEERIKRLLYGKGIFDILITDGDTEEFQKFLKSLSK